MRDPGGVRLGTVGSFAQIASKQDGNGGLQEARCALDNAGCHSQPALCVWCSLVWGHVRPAQRGEEGVFRLKARLPHSRQGSAGSRWGWRQSHTVTRESQQLPLGLGGHTAGRQAQLPVDNSAVCPNPLISLLAPKQTCGCQSHIRQSPAQGFTLH